MYFLFVKVLSQQTLIVTIIIIIIIIIKLSRYRPGQALGGSRSLRLQNF
jgi:hypothetical protein